MANTKQATKRAIQNERRAARNKSKISNKRSNIKAFLNAEGENVEQAFRDAISSIDRAARKGLIHKNAANRKKSQLARKYNA